MHGKWFKVGEVARRAGLTVRTLHHYDAIGLLSPAVHSPSGHRLYGVRELERLELILLYRQMGLALEEIRDAIDNGSADLAELLREHVRRIRRQVREHERQLARLGDMVARLEVGDVLTAGDLMETLEATAMFDRYYTPDQRAKLDARRKKFSSEDLQRVQQEWAELFDALEQARAASVPPDHASLVTVASRAGELIRAFTGGEADIAATLERMTADNPEAMFRLWGVSPELGEYYFAVLHAAASR